ncbi:hypothetical protein C4D60_Mb10t25330 [Musa balbisiana]|uniref:Uncharacterized protein n=2 Tax=Musa TaxID=4640 RepID=A0A4S8J269_MUSBA|nr:hypothetical protein C4D60_Mb10t25330 [Musa balbisiana]
MEMRKIACAVLVAAASASAALAAEAPAPGPASGSSTVVPAVGAVLGASVISFFAFYLQVKLTGDLYKLEGTKGSLASSLLVITSYSPLPFSSLDSRLGDLRSVVAALLCGSPLERRALDFLYSLLQICRDSGIYDLPR